MHGGSGPVVVMTAAWDDIFGYRALADAFPDGVRVVALVESGDRDDTTLHRVGPLVEAFVDALDRSRDERSVDWSRAVVLGWSVGGVVAHELGARLAADGRPPAAVALVDTYFPGEQRHLWSNRWWKYKSMLRPGRFSGAAREVKVMAGRRVRRQADRLGRRLLAWAGSELPPVAERTSVAGIPTAALDHEPSAVPVELVLYAVSTTNRERTEVPWRRLVPGLRVVPVEGRHRGVDSIMGADRVGQIVDDLMTNVFGAAAEAADPLRYDAAAHGDGGAASR
jgi:thioesterase domain-containing protein